MEHTQPEKIVRFCQLAHERIALGNYEGARTYLAAAGRLSAEPSPVLLRLQGICAAGLQDFAEALPLLEAALDKFRLAEEVQGEVMVAGDLAAVLQRQGELGRAYALITWAIGHVADDNQAQYVWLLNIAASIATLQGRLEDTLGLLDTAHLLAESQFSAWIDLHRAATLDLLGRHVEAAVLLDAAQAPWLPGDLLSEPLLAYAYTWHALQQGDIAAAYLACQGVMHHSSLDDQPLLGSSALATMGILARELDDFGRADAMLAEAAAAMERHGDDAALLGVRWHQALLARKCGDDEAALTQLDRLLCAMQVRGYGTTLLWQPAHIAELCRWAQSQGLHHPHLDLLLTNALAPWHSEPEMRCDAVLRDRLSVREYDVVSVLMLGLTDREIAAHLGISERTVQNHLQHIYAKLGVRGRTAVVGVVIVKG